MKKLLSISLVVIFLLTIVAPVTAESYKPQWKGPADGREAKFFTKVVVQSIDIPVQPTYFHREGRFSGYLEYSHMDDYSEYKGEMVLVYWGYLFAD
ncbi:MULTISPECIES: hypothetical protein [Ezakiella]|uniref:hypothetical protein n=1 Tax=Ezakiella TaxID=1582879 RepID=UPI00094F02D3|nr:MULTISPECIES: hypothetical protein [Ezakiella]